jgi:hypothetical protein
LASAPSVGVSPAGVSSANASPVNTLFMDISTTRVSPRVLLLVARYQFPSKGGEFNPLMTCNRVFSSSSFLACASPAQGVAQWYNAHRGTYVSKGKRRAWLGARESPGR